MADVEAQRKELEDIETSTEEIKELTDIFLSIALGAGLGFVLVLLFLFYSKSNHITCAQKSMRYRSMCRTLSRVRQVTFSQAVQAMLNLPWLQHSRPVA
jgi:hypothetical protein